MLYIFRYFEEEYRSIFIIKWSFSELHVWSIIIPVKCVCVCEDLWFWKFGCSFIVSLHANINAFDWCIDGSNLCVIFIGGFTVTIKKRFSACLCLLYFIMTHPWTSDSIPNPIQPSTKSIKSSHIPGITEIQFPQDNIAAFLSVPIWC